MKIDALTDVASLQSETTALQALNGNSDKITEAFDNTLSRDGSSPNAMGASLDMNSNRVINVGTPTSGSDAVTKSYVDDLLEGVDAALLADIGDFADDVALVEGWRDETEGFRDEAEQFAIDASNYIGAALTAQTLTTGRTMTYTGDVTGVSAAFDGSTNISTALSIAADTISDTELVAGAAVANIGYTPANKAGEGFTGDVQLNFTASTLASNSIGYRGIPIDTVNANYTFVLNDSGRTKKHTDGSSYTWTVPPNSDVAYPDGTIIVIRNIGAAVAVAQGAGVTIRIPGTGSSGNKSVAQWGLATLVKESTNEWIITGAGIS